jgi:putative PIN family toxin of toxin-antitoxin system
MLVNRSAVSPIPDIVLDTNIVLDLLVFNDPAAHVLCTQLERGGLKWLGTMAMRDELERVLAYPKIAPRLAYHGHSAAAILERLDTLLTTVPAAPKAGVTCKDADDQKFIDLAVQHRTLLLSKDRAVLCMARRLQALGADTRSVF